jgi:hypothetical protein
LIVYGVACLSYLQFYNWYVSASAYDIYCESNNPYSIGAASRGENEAIENDTNVLQAYDREHKQYPYKSRGQWLRAAYGLFGCSVMIFFNGWRSLAKPVSVEDFIASYISVSDVTMRNCRCGAYHIYRSFCFLCSTLFIKSNFTDGIL